MAVTFSGSSVTALAADIIQSAGYEIGVFAPGEAIPAADALWCLEKMQRIIDQWNAVRELIFSVGLQTFTIPPNTAPVTIGPTGALVPSDGYRPVRIGNAMFVLNAGSNAVDTPINLRDKDWWAGNPVKSQTSSIITDLFYDPAQPNGKLNFWPVCNGAGTVRLELWSSLKQAPLLTTALGFVQGYWEALTLTLAVSLCPSYERQPSPVLMERQASAMRMILANNAPPPTINTAGGMPSSGGLQPDFDFLTGMRRGFGL